MLQRKKISATLLLVNTLSHLILERCHCQTVFIEGVDVTDTLITCNRGEIMIQTDVLSFQEPFLATDSILEDEDPPAARQQGHWNR
jgi:hypothetical protein